MDMNRLRDQAARLAERAVPVGVLRYSPDGTKANLKEYKLEFNRETSCYDVTLDGEHEISFRTYKITQAKQWLREYLS